MNPYYTDEFVTLYHGDALDVIADLDAEVDAVVTDPPYASGTRLEAAGWLHYQLAEFYGAHRNCRAIAEFAHGEAYVEDPIKTTTVDASTAKESQ